VKSSYIIYTTMDIKLTLLIKMSPVGLTCLYTMYYVYVNLLRVSLIVTFFILVVNIIEDLLLLVESTCIDSLDIETLVVNIIEDLLLLVVSTRADPLVLLF
jgi:hypothetical protein